MEEVPSPTEKRNMISSFLEIAVGQTYDVATQFLQATSWKLEEAIQLFYLGNESGVPASSSTAPSDEDIIPSLLNEGFGGKGNDSGKENVIQDFDEVRPPLPVKRETLYDVASVYGPSQAGQPSNETNSLIAFRNFGEESASTTDVSSNSRHSLASLYRPPFELMHHGPFEKAKAEASFQDKWLLVNLQSTKEFSSHMLNRDTWSNEAVAQTISTNFIFWQVYEDTIEGSKVSSYYNVDSVPIILIIDPITGQKMRSWIGMVHAERLLEDLLPFLDSGPKDHFVTLSHKRPRQSNQTPSKRALADDVEGNEEISRAIAASLEEFEKPSKPNELVKHPSKEDGIKETYFREKPSYPPLSEEPKGDRSLICRIGVRLPDGRRVQRNFLRTDPIQLLWSFCCSHLDKGETRPFRLTHAIPGASKCLDYSTQLTFEESGLSNSMISVTWE